MITPTAAPIEPTRSPRVGARVGPRGVLEDGDPDHAADDQDHGGFGGDLHGHHLPTLTEPRHGDLPGRRELPGDAAEPVRLAFDRAGGHAAQVRADLPVVQLGVAQHGRADGCDLGSGLLQDPLQRVTGGDCLGRIAEQAELPGECRAGLGVEESGAISFTSLRRLRDQALKTSPKAMTQPPMKKVNMLAPLSGSHSPPRSERSRKRGAAAAVLSTARPSRTSEVRARMDSSISEASKATLYRLHWLEMAPVRIHAVRVRMPCPQLVLQDLVTSPAEVRPQ